ncbi:MAG: hypothetical protein RLY66_549 [Candidatus Parcubacteria bacterium]|jgi:glycosyltransferase involved in cell wall biosynthesis
MTMKTPIVSVILPVYNGENYLREGVKSILGQSFEDFELIVIDDGSTDGSATILNDFTDPRIIRVRHEKNRGVTKTLNEGIALARGEFIVRADADDISLSNRIEKQVAFMRDNPHVSISGSGADLFGTRNEQVLYPTSVAAIQSRMLFGNQIESSTVIMRTKDIRDKHISLPEKYRYENEYDFYIAAIKTGLKILNTSEVLVKKRIHPEQLSAFFESRVQAVELMTIQKEYFSFLIKSIYVFNPLYISCMIVFMAKRILNVLKFSYRRLYLKNKERTFYATGFEKCLHINCDTTELKDKNIIDIATVAFNKPEVIQWQIDLIKKNIRDPYFYTVFDNSNDPKKADEIQRVCADEQVAYVKLPKNHLTRSSSHGSSLNWIHRNYFQKRKASYFTFLDHDIFPIKETRLINILDTQSIYGLLQERKNGLWYLWAGFCSFKADAVPTKLNFLDGKIGAIGVDTGGMNWDPIYSKYQKKHIVFPPSKLEKIHESMSPTTIVNDHSLDMIEYIGDWLHLYGSSGWKTVRDQEERDRKIREIIAAIK